MASPRGIQQALQHLFFSRSELNHRDHKNQYPTLLASQVALFLRDRVVRPQRGILTGTLPESHVQGGNHHDNYSNHGD